VPSITVNGAELSYEIAQGGASSAAAPTGSGGDAEWIVLLNGVAMSIAHWKPIVNRLPGRFRCLLHDFRGQLLSPDAPGKPGAQRLEDHVEDLLALMDSVGVARAHLVGTSYGAEVAMLFAIAHPERTASLVSIDGVSELDPLLKAAVEAWKATALADPVAFFRTTLPWNYSAGYLGENAGVLAKREAAIAAMPRSWFTSFAGLCDAFLRIDFTKDLPRICCPTLVMVAAADILKGERFARILADNIPAARRKVIPEAGHAVVVEKPGETAAAVAEFLASLPPAARA
jgi:3-oxoadipate enol-lactonase